MEQEAEGAAREGGRDANKVDGERDFQRRLSGASFWGRAGTIPGIARGDAMPGTSIRAVCRHDLPVAGLAGFGAGSSGGVQVQLAWPCRVPGHALS